jgi:hypothetical protein
MISLGDLTMPEVVFTIRPKRAGLHTRNEGPHHLNRRDQVQLDRPDQGVMVPVIKGTRRGAGVVVHKNVDLARPGDHPCPAAFFGLVGRDEFYLSARFIVQPSPQALPRRGRWE